MNDDFRGIHKVSIKSCWNCKFRSDNLCQVVLNDVIDLDNFHEDGLDTIVCRYHQIKE